LNTIDSLFEAIAAYGRRLQSVAAVAHSRRKWKGFAGMRSAVTEGAGRRFDQSVARREGVSDCCAGGESMRT
jgi:hypothetical protein